MSQLPSPPPSSRNRRLDRRHSPAVKVKLVCRKGSLDLGPNLGLDLLDISETGIRLLLKQTLARGEEVTVSLDSLRHVRAVKAIGTVIWSVTAADGTCQVGVRLH